jgi:glycosyltransferase involved in cell wall biosynthesis
MAMGAVPIVVNYGGPAELVTNTTGFRVDIGPRAQIVSAFRKTIEAVAANPSSLLEMIENGRQRIHSHFTWEAKARQVVEVYRTLVDGPAAARVASRQDSINSARTTTPSPHACLNT